MGVFNNAISLVAGRAASSREPAFPKCRGLVDWLLRRLQVRPGSKPRLALVERINLGPHQVLALIEADGQQMLVATSTNAAPVFYPLCAPPARRRAQAPKTAKGKSA